MESIDEVLQEIKKKKVIIWWGIVFSGFCGLVGMISGDISVTLVGIGLVVVLIIALRKFQRFDLDLKDYQPTQGFRYYRKTREGKLKELTYTQYGVVALILLSIFFQIGIRYVVAYGISGILAVQFFIKRRIHLHTKIDDASLFELEEIGVITSKDIVKAIYKDFASWSYVEKGNKLLVVTEDCLICVIMETKEDAIRMEYRLKDIRKLRVLGNGKKGEGLLISIGTWDNRIFHVKLDGASSQDSPEEFFKHFLQALDEALSPSTQPTKGRSTTIDLQKEETQTARKTDVAVDNGLKPRLKIRELDFFDQETSTTTSTEPVRSDKRFLDL